MHFAARVTRPVCESESFSSTSLITKVVYIMIGMHFGLSMSGSWVVAGSFFSVLSSYALGWVEEEMRRDEVMMSHLCRGRLALLHVRNR